jgi:hypothetical protein
MIKDFNQFNKLNKKPLLEKIDGLTEYEQEFKHALDTSNTCLLYSSSAENIDILINSINKFLNKYDYEFISFIK